MSLTLKVAYMNEPLLEFGGTKGYFDPKEGLSQDGPFSLKFDAGHKAQVKVGLVGTTETCDLAARWFERCQQLVPSGEQDSRLHPDFPGFRQVFRSELDLANQWELIVRGRDLGKALSLHPRDRFKAVLELFAGGIASLAHRDVNKPDVVVCCLPEEVLQRCWSVSNPALTPSERRLLREQDKWRRSGMIPLFEDFWAPSSSPEELLSRSFRRALKARTMRLQMPIQIGTENLFVDSDSNQDPATRAWNVSVGLFYKAGGLPWRLASQPIESCFVGISFHHLKTTRRHVVYSSLAQAFPSFGEGFALRGDSVPWQGGFKRDPHLSASQAAALGESVLKEYSERTGGHPARMVLYKTSEFDHAEIDGFQDALNRIPIVDTVVLRPSGFRLLRRGIYPPNRGTLLHINDSVFLFTSGYIPQWQTYPGPHVPVPYELLYSGDSDIQELASEVLGLTKMNWNTAAAVTSIPVTLKFAREVGSIMAEVPSDTQPESSYRYYM